MSEVKAVTSIQGVSLAPGGELTSNIVSADGVVGAAVVLDNVDAVGTTPDTFEGRRGYRCAYSPING